MLSGERREPAGELRSEMIEEEVAAEAEAEVETEAAAAFDAALSDWRKRCKGVGDIA